MGKGIARINKDSAGGKLITPKPSNVYINNKMVASKGQQVAPHLPCPLYPEHCAATMKNEYSRTVYVNNRGVCRKDDFASCATHKITAASNNVYAD